MKFIYSSEHVQHAPSNIVIRGNQVDNLEQPKRIENLKNQLLKSNHELIPTVEFHKKWISAVHSIDYLNFLESAYPRWQEFIKNTVGVGSGNESSQIYPHISAHYSAREIPSSVQGQVGLYLSGGSCPIDVGTWDAAMLSAHTALTAASLILQNEKHVYALCRPPGHHAYTDMAGGFCYLNNAAIAANYLAENLGRVAIIDVDAHHGNGTQSIFYKRSDVFFSSVHLDPNLVFPFFSGYTHERGEKDGSGYNLNLPLPLGVKDEGFLHAVTQAMSAVKNYDPAALVVSLGFDPYDGDPSAGMSVSTEGFKYLGKILGGFKGPILIVQEGGYVVDKLAYNLDSFLSGFLPIRDNFIK